MIGKLSSAIFTDFFEKFKLQIPFDFVFEKRSRFKLKLRQDFTTLSKALLFEYFFYFEY